MMDELLDEPTADAIAGGDVDRDLLAPPLRALADLVDRARRPAEAEELASEDTVVQLFVQQLAASRAATQLDGVRRARAKRRAAKAIAALAIVAFTGTAAAATNQLPEAVQTAISDAGSHVGLHLPKAKHGPTASDDPSDADADSDSDSGAETGASTDMSGKVGGQGPDATGSAKGGLCTAHFARGATTSEHAGGVAEDNLQAAATAAGQSVDEFCASAVHETSSSESESTPDQADDGAPSNNGGEKSQKPTDPGPPSDDPGASGDPNKAKKAKSPSTPGASGGS